MSGGAAHSCGNISHGRRITFIPTPSCNPEQLQEYAMPIITNINYYPSPFELEQPLSLDISLRLTTAGPITIRIALDETRPFLFISAGKRVRELLFYRTFGFAGNHTTRFTMLLTG